jgi:hypothetical protein
LGRVTEDVRVETAAALIATLTAAGGGGGAGVAEAALAVRSLATAAPESAASLLRDAVTKMKAWAGGSRGEGRGDKVVDAGVVVGAAAAAAALIAAGDVFELGLPSGLLKEAAVAGRAIATGNLVGGMGRAPDGEGASAAVRERGWGVVAAALAGPAGAAEVEANGDAIAAALALAFDPDALAAVATATAVLPPPLPLPSSLSMLTPSKRKGARAAAAAAPAYAPSAELRWRAAAAGALAAFVCRLPDHPAMPDLLRAALMCASPPLSNFALTVAPAGGSGLAPTGAWPADPATAAAAATLRLRVLEALAAVPGGAASYAPLHGELLAVCTAAVWPLPGGAPGPVSAAAALRCPTQDPKP